MPNNTSPLFIDKLAVTLPVPVARCNEVQVALEDAERWRSNISVSHLSSGRYRHRYDLTASEEERVSIFSSPRGSANFLKLEYSPRNIGEEGSVELATLLRQILGEDFRELFYEGNATRVDIAFDVHRIDLANLWVEDNSANKSALIRGCCKRVETIYLPFKATRQLCIYDKRQERRDTEGTPDRAKAPSIVRFEYRYSKGDYRLRQLANGALENPFHRYSVRTFKVLPALGDLQSRLLFDACRLHGARNAITLASGPEQEHYGRLIDQFPVPIFWQRRTRLWGQFKECVEGLLPTFPIL